MLNKLLKYDFKALLKMHLPLYIALFVLAILTRVFSILGNHFSILGIVKGFMITIFVILLIASFVGTFLICVVRFYQNLIKDEGYLTHTLPVKESSLILSKTISSFLMTTLTNVIIIIAALLAFYQDGFFSIVGDILNQLSAIYQIPVFITTIALIITYLIGNLCNLLLLYTAIGLGQLYSGKKMIYSLVYMIVLYTVIQILTSIFLFGCLWLIPGLLNEMNSDIPSRLFMSVTFGISNFLNIVLIIAFYYGTTYLFTKKLNME